MINTFRSSVAVSHYRVTECKATTQIAWAAKVWYLDYAMLVYQDIACGRFAVWDRRREVQGNSILCGDCNVKGSLWNGINISIRWWDYTWLDIPVDDIVLLQKAESAGHTVAHCSDQLHRYYSIYSTALGYHFPRKRFKIIQKASLLFWTLYKV